MISNQKSYLACYYHIKAPSYIWKDGSQIKIFIDSAYDVIFEVFGGTSRTNASIATIANNQSYTSG